jgi:hypothetical protein
MKSQFMPIDQVRYVSKGGDKIQYGFVTSVDWEKGWVWVRYWREGHPDELRTKSNSERTRIEDLSLFRSHTEEQIRDAIDKYNIRIQGDGK